MKKLQISSSETAILKFLVCLVLAMYGCDAYPRDPHETLENIQQTKILRIGVIEHLSWAYREGGLAKGVEPAIVRDFASSLGATPQWKFMSEAEAENQLKQHRVDLVIGGLTKAIPARKKWVLHAAIIRRERIKRINMCWLCPKVKTGSLSGWKSF